MKDKTAAGILAIILGTIGGHRFYLGQWGLGILYLFMAMFTAGIIPFMISIIDAIIFFTQSQESFDAKYNSNYQPRYQPERRGRRDRRGERGERRGERSRYVDREAQRAEEELNRQKDRFQRNRDERERRLEERRREKDELRRKRKAELDQKRQSTNKRRVEQVSNTREKKVGIEKLENYEINEALEFFKKAVKKTPRDGETHFYLAAAYSHKEEIDKAFFHLGEAVKNGFKDFERIKSYDFLAYLRSQDEFERFVENGYSMLPVKEEEKEETVANDNEVPKLEIPQNNLLDELKKLAELRTLGVLTEDEFIREKQKILDRH